MEQLESYQNMRKRESTSVQIILKVLPNKTLLNSRD